MEKSAPRFMSSTKEVSTEMRLPGGMVSRAFSTRLVRTRSTSTRRAIFRLPPAAYIALTVSDTGSGMDEATRSRIFEPLSIPRKAAAVPASAYPRFTASSSRAAATSRCKANQRRELPSPAASKHASIILPPHKAATILFVESDRPLRELACTLLQAAAYRVIEAQDAQAALDILRSSTPVALSFADVIMPGKSGIELAAEAKLLCPNQFPPKPFTRLTLLTRIHSPLHPTIPSTK
jgi:CheY-like chemotaxis protein